MKFKYLLVALYMFLLVAGCTHTNVFVKNREQLKKINKIAVLPFICNNRAIGYNIAETLSANLLESRFTIIERSQLDKLLAEQGLNLVGVLENYQSIIGKVKGVDAIIAGSASTSSGFAGMLYGGYIEYVSNCTARMINVVTGEVIIAVTFTAESANAGGRPVTATRVGAQLAKKLMAY